MKSFVKNPSLSFPLLILLVLAPFLTVIDLKITRFFYAWGNDPVEHFMSHQVLDFLFVYGLLPAQVASGIAAAVLALSYLVKSLQKWRSLALTMVLSLAIGSGLVTHLLLKDHWGRPRPKQVKEFGGSQEFRSFYQPNFFQTVPSRSFPCGHCTMGFFFFTLAIAGKRMQNKTVRNTGYIVAFGLGILLSAARIAQGAHFFSDTLFSAAIMWYAALSMDWLVYSDENAYSFAETRI